MDDAETKAAAVIIRNIDQLESAVAFASTKMDASLFEAVCETLTAKNEDLRWESGFGSGFADDLWLAPSDWRADGEDVGGDYDLLCYLDVDEFEAQTWVAYFASAGGRKVYLCVSTNTVSGKKNLKRLAVSVADDLQKLVDAGFLFDVETFTFKLPVSFDREQIAQGFADDDLSQALAPLGRALDLVSGSREIFDRMRDAVRLAAA